MLQNWRATSKESFEMWSLQERGLLQQGLPGERLEAAQETLQSEQVLPSERKHLFDRRGQLITDRSLSKENSSLLLPGSAK